MSQVTNAVRETLRERSSELFIDHHRSHQHGLANVYAGSLENIVLNLLRCSMKSLRVDFDQLKSIDR